MSLDTIVSHILTDNKMSVPLTRDAVLVSRHGPAGHSDNCAYAPSGLQNASKPLLSALRRDHMLPYTAVMGERTVSMRKCGFGQPENR